MKKITKVVATTLMALALVACDSHSHQDLQPTNSGAYSPAANAMLQAFELSEVNLSLTEGQSHQLELLTLPVLESLPSVTYTSNNPSVASVDSTGKVTAKSSGFAKISVKCGDFSRECYVSVTTANSRAKALSNCDEIIAAQQDASFVRPRYLKTFLNQKEVVKRGEEIRESTNEFETIVLNLDEAYIYIDDSYVSETKTGQNLTYSKGKWVIYCTDEFETFLFHESQGVRKYIKVDCSKYVEADDRWLACANVLDNLFTYGADQFVEDIDDVAGLSDPKKDLVSGIKDILQTPYSNVKNVDARGDDAGNMWSTYTLIEEELMGFDMIAPSGTMASFDVAFDYYHHDNYLQYSVMNQLCSYEWRGDDWTIEMQKIKNFDIEEEELYYPDIKAEGWVEGEDIYDI